MPIVIGGLFIVGGSLVVFGAISGRLASMLGAIVGIGSATDGNGVPIVAPTTPAASAPPNGARITAPTSPNQGPPVNLGPGSGQATLPSVGGGPPAPTFG